MCKNVKRQKNYRIFLYMITEKQRREVAFGVNVDPTVVGGLKAMLKKLCVERPKDWGRYLESILFAYREVKQESTGFSPFELLYGRTVRGPMAILRELWTKEQSTDKVRTTYQYVLELRNRLE